MQLTNTSVHFSWKLCIDGASRANPGLSGVGILVIKNGKKFEELYFYTGIKTNNQAEYLALIIGLFFLKKYVAKNDSIVVVSDSELMVRQLNRIYRVKHEGLRSLFNMANELMKELNISITHVPREKNSRADELANLGIDEKICVPDEIVVMLHEYAIML